MVFIATMVEKCNRIKIASSIGKGRNVAFFSGYLLNKTVNCRSVEEVDKNRFYIDVMALGDVCCGCLLSGVVTSSEDEIAASGGATFDGVKRHAF
jgi:hypothetical protein